MIKIRTVVLIFLLTISLDARELQKVSLQLQWLDQFQFAGYYMAKEKGFYRDAGLDVELRKFNNKIDTVDEVMSRRATYGVGRSSLIFERSKGVDIVLLASILQSSPSVMIALKDSNITTVKDFVGHRVMVTDDVVLSGAIRAMWSHYGISVKDVIKQKHSFSRSISPDMECIKIMTLYKKTEVKK